MKIKWMASSYYYRVVVDATMEEQIFTTLTECKKWALKVQRTFDNNEMTFTVYKCREWQTHL